MFEQQLHHFNPVLLAGDVERSEAIKGSGVGISLAVQQQFGHTDMATVGRHMQGSEVVHRHLIHGGPMIQQDACCIHMITL